MNAAYGKTIRIYLKDRTASGIKVCEIFNNTIIAISSPRTRIAELQEMKEAVKPAVYMLFGIDRDSGRDKVYIGETEGALSRLKTQLIKKDFWHEMILFTSKDEYMTKAHVRHLEGKLIKLARIVNRYQVENDKQTHPSSLSMPDVDAMEEFLENVKLLLGALGHKVLEPLTPLNVDLAPQEFFHHPGVLLSPGKVRHIQLQVNGLFAKGLLTDEGVVVLKGSEAAVENKMSLANGYLKLKERLVNEGILIRQDDRYIFNQDQLFQTATPAAAIIVGTAISGRGSWKDENGVAIKDV